MKRNQSDVHPEDMLLLAYLDAELPRETMRSTQQHLQACWKCRASLAELEFRAQAVSKLLSQQDESDITRVQEAKARFLDKKSLFEVHRRRSETRFASILGSQGTCGGMLGWLER